MWTTKAMRWVPVSTLVNNPKDDEPECLRQERVR
jgi:hypothetical protein